MTLGELYDELTHSLASARPSRGVVERVRERGAPGIPLNGRALEVRDRIRGVLAGWAAVVRDGRGVRVPTRDTAALLVFLGRHAGWLAGHEAVEDLVAETDELVTAAWGVLSGRSDRRMVVGPCVRPGCRGTLVAHLGSGTGPSAPRAPGAPAPATGRAAITCTVERRHTWSPELWHSLHTTPPRTGRTATGGTSAAGGTPAGGTPAGRTPAARTSAARTSAARTSAARTSAARTPAVRASAGLTAQDIATGWRIAAGTVYWLANTHHWRRRKNGRQVYYDRDDVLATMRARAAAAGA
ncbi:hypothetical protein [Streptomyces fradiae]|uniref:hypothetical protein n=1 Tax=Streptomyces fradiae TaxID=1906 RepID=UPI0035BE91F5